MRYLIDGYNLLHAMGVLAGRVGPHGLEKARLALLGRLLALHANDPGAVTVVFDAAKARAGAEREQEHKGLHVLYALREEADDVIEAIIRREATPRRLTVVSDDRRLKEAARRRRCPALGCLDYVEQVGRSALSASPLSAGETGDAAEAPAKPRSVSAEETQRWLKEFGDLADDPKLKDWVELEAPEDPEG
ncbi:MAG TPA: NYN domain-containing protein [Gemmataceae bacterium]|nr:NYN domain-containing protein [Gemmataceae bacterium]